MIKTADPTPTALLGWMDSLADESRLRILRLLERHELGVVELCDVLQMPQSTVSRHLKVLGNQGWTTSRRQGTANLYRMVVDELTPFARRLWLLAREQTEDWATLGQDRLRLDRRLKERRRASEEFFASQAERWDKIRQTSYGSAFYTAAAVALVPDSWTVADLGCGTGTLTAELAGQVSKVIGIDQSSAMLDAARQRVGDHTNVDLREGDLESIPVDDKACDAAVMVLVLTYLDHPREVLAEMHRIIKPGGKAVIVDVLRHDRDDFRREMGQQSLGFTPEALSQLFADAGFRKPRCTPLPPEADANGPALLMGTATRSQ